MTQPGYVEPPSPGWWERKDRIGVGDSEYGWDTHAVGLKPSIDYRRPLRIANPNVGPMAMRNKFRRKPISRTRRIVPTFDAIGAGNQVLVANKGSISWSHTIGTAATAVVVSVNVQNNDTLAPTISATVGGSAMTLLGSCPQFSIQSGYYLYQWFFGILNPGSGSKTVAVTFNSASAGYYTTAQSVSYNSVSSFGTVATATGSGTSPSLVVPSQSGDLVAQVFGGYTSNFSSYTQSARSTQNYGAGAGGPQIMGDGPGAASLTFGVSSASQPWAGIGVPLQP